MIHAFCEICKVPCAAALPYPQVVFFYATAKWSPERMAGVNAMDAIG